MPDAGLSAADANIDRSITTASVTETFGPDRPNALGLDSDTYLDGETIASAVSAVQFSGKAIAWQNPATGSTGEISSVTQQQTANGALCRKFNALRNSFDGIRNYSGTACMNDAGTWRLTAFQPS